MYKFFLRFFSAMRATMKNEIYYKYTLKNLIKNGLKIGKNVYIDEDVIIDPLYPYLVQIGDDCRIGEGTIILSHDATIFRSLGVTRLGKVRILQGTFISANTIILPGCTIGPNAMVAAGSVVNRDIGEGQSAAGNPARIYGKYDDIINKYREEIDKGSSVFDKKKYKQGEISKQDILAAVEKEKWAFMAGDPDRGKARYGWF